MQYLGTDDQGTNSFSLQDFEPSFGSKLNASVRESWLESYGPVAKDWWDSRSDDGTKRLSAVEAQDYAKTNGGGVKLNITPKDGQYTAGQWGTIVSRQRELAAVKDVRERTPWDMGSVVRGGAMFGAGIVDPINLATAFVPWTRVIGAARGLQAAVMAESALTRAGARAGLGAIDAGVSTAVMEPAFSYGRGQLGDDYGALDSMANIAFGTAFGGGLHVIGGAGADALKSWRGSPATMVTPNPSMDTAAPLAGAAAGLDTRVKVGDAYEPARWSVVEADTLQATVDKADNQFRDRSRPAYQAEIQSRANALDPAMVLGDSPVMDIGAPTLAADGRIVGGNGRTLFINKAYEIGKGGDYRAALEARLTDLGIDVDAVRGMSKPVLVRQFTREVDVKRAAMLSNEGGATDMSPLEQAKVDAERLGDARLSVSADGDINNADNRVAIRKWVEAQPDNKRNSIMDSDGKLSPEGLRRLNGAMLFKAYGDTPVLARLIEAVDPGSRNLALALGRTAPVVANSRAAIAAGDLHPLDIASDLQQAVEKYNQIRGQGGKVSEYLAQLDAFGDGLTPEATMLLDFMGRNIQSPRRIMDAITGFADRLNEAGNPKQSDMFGAASAPDKTRMLEDAIAAAEARPDSATEVVAGLAPETREAALRASVAQSVDGRDVDVDAVIGLDPDRATHTIEDAKAAADRNFEPDQVSVADADASADVQARVDAAPKWHALKDAEDALADADVLLADTVAAGDQAFKYSREAVDPEKVSTPDTLTESLRQSFGASTERLMQEGRIKLVATPDEIPGGPHPGDVKAATAPDGTVYVVASNVSELEARGILLHEVGVHVGMEKMLGTDVFRSVLRELDDAIGRGEDWAQAARSRVPKETPADLVREEQLAYLVQHAPELPIVQRIMAAVRAWVYRTFEFARETVKEADGKERTRVQLTEADFRAMAVAALHDAARKQDAPDVAFAYSRGETPDPSTTKDELKPYDDAVKRAKGYASVLRSAADKLENDAQATAAMRAAMPDISPQEINDLLFQLRKQVKGLRGMTRSARDALAADEMATGMQYDAMQAADTLANNIEMAAVIEKRNAKLNMNVRLKATAYVNQFRDAGLDFEGFRGLLVGTERKRAGGRVSVESEQKNFRGEWLGGMIADLEKQGLMRAFASGEFDRDAYAALYNLAKDGAGNEKLPKEAVAIAEIVNKYQSDARNTRNRFGAWIRDLQGYIVRQSHDMFKIRNAGEKAYKEAVLPLLDLKRSMRDFDGSADDFLTRVYDDFAAGSHMKTAAGEDDLQAFGAGSSLARKESQSRVLYFKDGDSAYQYNQKFGQGRLAESVLGGLDHAAKSAGLLKLLGTNPQATAERLFKDYAESLRGDPKRRSAFLSHRNELDNLLATIDGSANIPGNATAAKISSFFRAWQSMSKLGGMLISSVTDLTNYAAELRFGQDKNLLSGTLESIGALTRGRAAGEKQAILNSLGVFHESTLGSVFARFDSPDLLGGKTAAAMQMFFKLSGINWWTETLRDGYALSHSAYVSSHSGKSFDKLPDALRDMLGLYNVDAGKWDVLRLAKTQMADGRGYITPDGLRTVPRAALENYIIQAGRKVTDAAIMNLQDDLSSALRTMTIDRMHHAVIEPGARARAFMLRGTQPGTVPGELLRFVSQFKSFPVALIQSTLGREVYGRGYDTLGDYVKRGKGDMLGLASFIALSMAMGYAAMSIKDLLRGKNPRPVDDPRTWAAAMVQGGGLGIYGDFLFGKFNRMGGSLSGSMAGPVANLADTAADLWTRIRTGDDVAATAFNAALQNTPFANLFYTRVALDYLVLHRIQEAMNPGFLKRMERRVERDNGQTFFMPPSQVAR